MSNIHPVIGNDDCVVSLRSMITADNEPHMFTTLFSGSIVVRSFDFLEYGEDDELGYVMLYQLIGVPYINQKAVEVPVKWSSLSTTGMYIMLADDYIFYWIGKDYFSRYTTTKYLTSEDMLKKLNYIYEEEASELISDEKNIHYILEGMETDLFTQILTKDGEFDIEMPDYESELVTNNIILPSSPRCYCLYQNGIIPEYFEALIDDRRHEVENENLMFKEILNFDQLTLRQKGIYLLMLQSDAYLWVGSLVIEDDFFQILKNLPMKISDKVNLHIVHEFYEPEVFIEIFPNWKPRTK